MLPLQMAAKMRTTKSQGQTVDHIQFSNLAILYPLQKKYYDNVVESVSSVESNDSLVNATFRASQREVIFCNGN
jgi:hypothetical protein